MQEVKAHYWTFGLKGQQKKNNDDLIEAKNALFPYKEGIQYDWVSQNHIEFENGADLVEQFETINAFAENKFDSIPCTIAITLNGMKGADLEEVSAKLVDKMTPGVQLVLMHQDKNAFDGLLDKRGITVKSIPNDGLVKIKRKSFNYV